jgi:hypothetical protein
MANQLLRNPPSSSIRATFKKQQIYSREEEKWLLRATLKLPKKLN